MGCPRTNRRDTPNHPRWSPYPPRSSWRWCRPRSLRTARRATKNHPPRSHFRSRSSRRWSLRRSIRTGRRARHRRSHLPSRSSQRWSLYRSLRTGHQEKTNKSHGSHFRSPSTCRWCQRCPRTGRRHTCRRSH
ncbi:MAG: hypothetical protein AMJ75_01165 [Phycisphaerae bacterium SM1_79]|nr:MAG: hypothetical protein AMJ75_01165 [Phycisphaerae bacterium SM1_79]